DCCPAESLYDLPFVLLWLEMNVRSVSDREHLVCALRFPAAANNEYGGRHVGSQQEAGVLSEVPNSPHGNDSVLLGHMRIEQRRSTTVANHLHMARYNVVAADLFHHPARRRNDRGRMGQASCNRVTIPVEPWSHGRLSAMHRDPPAHHIAVGYHQPR